MTFFIDADKEINWTDICIHAGISLAFGIITGGFWWWLQFIHGGWMVREFVQRIQKDQEYSRLFRGRQVLLEWLPPLIIGPIAWYLSPFTAIADFIGISIEASM
ncbi:MAG: hypothetical protein AB7L09_21185 [Nitrospira sp.]